MQANKLKRKFKGDKKMKFVKFSFFFMIRIPFILPDFLYIREMKRRGYGMCEECGILIIRRGANYCRYCGTKITVKHE
jgi:hypothetical protein